MAEKVLATGTQVLRLRVRNPTSVLAREIRVRLDETRDLEWHHREAQQRLIEGGQEVLLRLELEAHQPGSYRVTGRLEAEDVAGAPFTFPFAFKLSIAQAGQPYRIPNIQPYVVGEGVPDDRTFVGRTELLHWLRSRWLQPQGKPAVALVGQRRIGKTSLLNKIKRDGLSDTGLIPILINIQGVASDYDFLTEAMRQMAQAVSVDKPPLDRQEPYAGFKEFLLGLGSVLDERRFLLMLDEADLIPKRRLGDLLPDFLRALMQEPQYPTLLLFCGTYALKRMSREYSSILFNTAQFCTISYMTQAESAEVLEKPVKGILEFDPAVLEEAYRMTRGQPYQLQALGAALIGHFNAAVFNERERSNYVTLNDLDQAVTALMEQGHNAAFENHWVDTDAPTHWVLAALAWATDETGRRQLNIQGIEAALQETRLNLPRGETYPILERLTEEEMLDRDGPTYRFAVPLYRRWIAWRWPPERVRQEAMAFQ